MTTIHSMTFVTTLVLFLYFLVLVILGVFGIHRYLMVYLYSRNRDQKARFSKVPVGKIPPMVTVQLPLFNEMYVAERLIRSVSQIRYPLDRLEIQVLDDSTDETTAIAEAATREAKARGLNITMIHRNDRQGFKAGALENGLRVAKGEFILIFDADFIAPADILELSLGHFEDERVGMVQARWGHVNRGDCLLTEFQSIMLDGHFILEHGGRNRGGRFFNFNGTAGVWRKKAIVDAGGWEHDTLTEDLDLSYRAQMRGWRFVFIEDLICPAELPADIDAFKSQQARWAKGSTEVCLKLLPRLLASPLPWEIRLEAAFHLTANFAYPLMVILSLLMFPAMVLRYNMGWTEALLIDIPLFLGATASIGTFYSVAQRQAYGPGRFLPRLRYIPGVLALGIGLSIGNARAVLGGLIGERSEFVRTPKLGILAPGDEPRRYRGQAGTTHYLEFALALYFGAMAAYAVHNALWASLPFIVLFGSGYFYIAALSLAGRIDRPAPAQAIEA